MADLKLNISLQQDNSMPVLPGSTLQGTVTITSPDGEWEADSIEVVLFWRTSGIGTDDEGVADSKELVQKGTLLPSLFTRNFEVRVPLEPWSYQGRLIKINWQLGLYVKKGWFTSPNYTIPLTVWPHDHTPMVNDKINTPLSTVE